MRRLNDMMAALVWGLLAACLILSEARNRQLHDASIRDRARIAALLGQVEREMARFHPDSHPPPAPTGQ